MHPTKIEWTDFAWNPIRARNRETGEVGHYCQKISPACTNCYAAAFNVAQRHKRKDGQPGKSGTGLDFIPASLSKLDLFLDMDELLSPLRRKKPARIFVCDMTDLFLDANETGWIDMVFAVMGMASQHTFQVLTKRAKAMFDYFSHLGKVAEAWQEKIGNSFSVTDLLNIRWVSAAGPAGPRSVLPHSIWPLPNVHLGVTAEDQQRANERIEWLVKSPAATKFVSYEPALELIDWTEFPNTIAPGTFGHPLTKVLESGQIDQIIMGGESGRGARPMHPTWARITRDRCQAAGVAFFFKQHGDWCAFQDIPDEWLWTHELAAVPEVVMGKHTVHRIGKAAAGRLLDGRTWDEFPTVTKGVE